MMDPNVWTRTIPFTNKKKIKQEEYNLDHSKWIDTLPKKNTKECNSHLLQVKYLV